MGCVLLAAATAALLIERTAGERGSYEQFPTLGRFRLAGETNVSRADVSPCR